MSNPSSFSFGEVLAAEFQALRQRSGYTAGSYPELLRQVHAEAEPFSALCISGGGIRSATFALGAIQGLAEQGLLGGFDYLSTVSGGGYIGGWLTAWRHRAGGLDKVIPHLLEKEQPVPRGEPNPIEHLREYNNYLSPRLGLFSVDTWTLASTVLRNMFLNWLVFLPLLMAALLVPRLMLSLGRLGQTVEAYYPSLAQAADAGWLSPVISAVCAASFGIAVYNMMRYLPGVGRVDNSEFDFLKGVLLPAIVAPVAFVANDSWFTGGDTPQLLGYWPVLGGAIVPACAAALGCRLACRKQLAGQTRVWLGVAAAMLSGGWIAASTAWMLANYFYPNASWQTFTASAVPALLMAVLLAGSLFVGFSSRQLKDEDREWLSRAGAWMLLFVVGWSGVSVIVLFAPAWVLSFPVWGKTLLVAAGGTGGVISALAGKSPNTDATRPDAAQSSGVMSVVLALAAPVFAIAVLAGLGVATDWLLGITGLGPGGDWWNHQEMLEGTRVEAILLLGAILLGVAGVMARFININRFSLHAMYRDRLIRAYLGASNPRREANKFTGFAESDNLPMYQIDPRQKPFPVVNVTLNLVRGERLAWQQRKAEAFTISPLFCGCADLGYRPSSEYGAPEGITLGTAVAISGAAASPNMGYHSSPLIAFIMTLFNARLGCWLGNPGAAGEQTWRSGGPTSAIGSLVREAFGLTNNSSEWVYLSDGGHFENLALYEMVRRRCRYVVVLDGGSDPEFSHGDLANALRKIRIDLKIPIDFDEASFHALREKNARWALARIRYRVVDACGEDGYLIYVKPMIRGNEPPDVASYYSDHGDFPHETTANQFFNESQTESYRALGLHTISEMCDGWDTGQGIAGLATHLHTGVKAAVAS